MVNLFNLGQHFDMSPDRFTLEAMFAMELHRYQDICEEIIANAVKELSIEKGVKEISVVSVFLIVTLTICTSIV